MIGAGWGRGRTQEAGGGCGARTAGSYDDRAAGGMTGFGDGAVPARGVNKNQFTCAGLLLLFVLLVQQHLFVSNVCNRVKHWRS